MPNRILRDATGSRKLALVTAEAERLYWRLLMIADDFGRFDADPAMLRARCFPRLTDNLKVRIVKRWRDELASAGLVKIYLAPTSNGSVSADEIGQFASWNQRIRNPRSKFPDAVDGQMTVICPSDDGHLRAQTETETETLSTTPLTTLPPSPPGRAVDTFEAFWQVYPKKRKKGDAGKAWGVLKPSADLVKRILEAVRTQRQSRDWLKAGGKYIPYPATWLRAQQWEDVPDLSPPDDHLPGLDEPGWEER